MIIRPATNQDFDAIWPFFRDIARSGETYAYPTDISKDQAFQLWMEVPEFTYVAELNEEILGSYYLKTNQQGPGCHVCNCGYMVAPEARGKGVATTMCEHSQTVAIEAGYLAMQFNLVASTNTGAVRLWHSLGYTTVGTLPKGFNHPQKGLVDAYVMYKALV